MVEASATYIVQNEGRLPAWGRGTLTSAVQAELVRFVDDNDIRLTVTVPGSRTNTNPAGEQFILEGGGTVDRARPRTNGRSPEQRILNRTFQAVQSNQPTLTPQLQTSIFGSLNRAFSDRPTNSSPSRYNLAAARTALRGRSLTLGNLYAAIHDCNTANLDTICLDDIV
ncbi:hypothetical protein HZB07_00870, partial [Candidatus Saganbacteria bacterium]|nr:hypothetical protein [Candidatus Saganbacteria bacterium]